MCEFENKFLLCTCSKDNISTNEIDWILRRRESERKTLNPLIKNIGQRILPKDFDHYNSIEFQELKKDIIEKMESLQKESTYTVENYKDITTFILSNLNNENCFDKEIELSDKDVLSIRLDKELGLWVDFIYRKKVWRIVKFDLDKNLYSEIIKGKIKPTHNKAYN